jgi:hypothetical protein
VPQGYHAFSVELEPLDGLTTGELAAPAARPFTVAGLDESFMVHERVVQGTLPFVLTRNLGPTTVRIRIGYQACTEIECWPPTTMSREIVLNGLDLIRN